MDIKKHFLLFTISLIVSCSNEYDNFSIKDTNLKIGIPSAWIKFEDSDFNTLLANSENYGNFSPEFSLSIQQIQENENIDGHLFINPILDSTNIFNSSIMITSMSLYGQPVLLTDIVEIQRQAISNVSEVIQNEQGRCPTMSFTAYECFMIVLNGAIQPITQYQYFLIDNGRLVNIAFTSSTSENLPIFTEIIRNISR
ncbi:hypothetical protein OAP18_01325 [Gammaproteobacteria bacterium]|nr:hypothetical protein [Gammaproteobacteria bacterium]